LNSLKAEAQKSQMPRLIERNLAHGGEETPGISILVVDDESLIRWSLRQGLSERGHSVTTAASGAEALNAIKQAQAPFDVVILDYRLPDRQDLTLLEDVRHNSPASAVMMMTAFADDTMKTGAQERGALNVVDKPFVLRTFVSLVEASVAR
jgi:DNA-binding NtrC family response regulator